jgi:hypothetical protein
MIKRLLCLIIFFLISFTSAYTENNSIKPEMEIADVRLGLGRADLIKIIGTPESESVIIAPRTGIVYNFMNYQHSGILVILKDNVVSCVSIFFPCKAKTSKGIAIGDNLDRAKKFYGNYVKESIGYASKFSFPEYNLSVKGLKGTVTITEITIGTFDLLN